MSARRAVGIISYVNVRIDIELKKALDGTWSFVGGHLVQHKRFSNLFYYDSCICAENIGKEKSFLFFVGRYLAHDCIRSRMKLNRLFCLRLVRVVFSFRLADFFSVAVCRSTFLAERWNFFYVFSQLVNACGYNGTANTSYSMHRALIPLLKSINFYSQCGRHQWMNKQPVDISTAIFMLSVSIEPENFFLPFRVILFGGWNSSDSKQYE